MCFCPQALFRKRARKKERKKQRNKGNHARQSWNRLRVFSSSFPLLSLRMKRKGQSSPKILSARDLRRKEKRERERERERKRDKGCFKKIFFYFIIRLTYLLYRRLLLRVQLLANRGHIVPGHSKRSFGGDRIFCAQLSPI